MPSLTNMLGLAAAAVSLGNLVSAQQYVLEDTYDTTNFFKSFEFFSGEDPTHGFVDYQPKIESNNLRLAGFAREGIYLGADHETPDVQPGRKSVRVSSTKTYTYGLVVADIAHMPGGCGIWPAFWTFGPGWPNAGEIDIIEGVNSQLENAITLHTGPSCDMTADGVEGSTTMEDGNCNANSALTGCSQKTKIPFGKAFNDLGGGVYAMEWTSASISVWFFPRNSIPEDVTSDNPVPGNWGAPNAKFNGGAGCNIAKSFHDHQIIFNTDFCGDWAGAVWGEDPECAALAPTCEEFVSANPNAFNAAYWLINSLKVYNQAGPGKRDNAKQTAFKA